MGDFRIFDFFLKHFNLLHPPLIFAILEKKIWILFLIFLLRNGTVHPLKSLVSLHVRKDNVKIYALLVISILSYLYLRQLWGVWVYSPSDPTSSVCVVPSSTHRPAKLFISPIYSRDRCRRYLATLLICNKSGNGCNGSPMIICNVKQGIRGKLGLWPHY